jgi:hypothetical protein
VAPPSTSRRYLPSTRNPLHLLVALLLVVAVGLFAYSRYATLHQRIDPWTLVPDDAVMVIETSNSPVTFRNLERSDLWPTLLTSPDFQRSRELMSQLDSLHNSSRQTLERFLTGKRILLSLHPSADSDGGCGLLMLVPVQSVRQHRYVRTLLEDIARSAQFTLTRQEIAGILVTQLDRPAGTAGAGPVLTLVSYRNTLLISPSRTLVEAAVRRIERGVLHAPGTTADRADYLRLPTTTANVWLNYRQLPAALAPLFTPAARPAVEELSSLGIEGLGGLELKNELLRLRGFTSPETARGALAIALGHQDSRPIRLWNVLTDRTAVLLHFGLPDPRALRAAAHGALPPSDSLETTLGPLLDSLAFTFQNEAALCLPALADLRATQAPDRLAYAYCADPLRTVRALNRLPGGRGAVESFGGYVIRPVRVPDLPRRLFGALFAGFDPAGTDGAVVVIGHYAVFGPTPQSLRALLLDLAGGHRINQAPPVLAQGQRAATLTVYVQTANAWSLLQRALQPAHRVDALRNESLIRRFPTLAFQVSRPDASTDAWYTTLVVQHAPTGEVGVAGSGASGGATATAVPFEQPLVSTPLLVRGGVGGPDVVVQDASFVLHALDAGGHEIWGDTLTGPIAGSLLRTPTGAGRSRLLLATAAQLHAFETPTGRDVENFPFYLSDSLRIQHLTAFTADAPDFTLIVDDPSGNLYAFDAQGRALPGWQPRVLPAPLADEPQAIRVEGRDLLVAALTNGDVFVLDRAGGVLPGFPVSADGVLAAGSLAVEPATTVRASKVSVVTTSGRLSTFSLRGEPILQRALPRVGNDPVRFELIPYDNGTAGVPPTGEFIVSRQEQGRVTLLDPETGATRLSRSFLTAAPKVVQAFRLIGGGGTVFALTERGPARTYLYDEHGQPLGVRVLDSDRAIALTFNPQTGELVAWTTTGKTLRRFAFRK